MLVRCTFIVPGEGRIRECAYRCKPNIEIRDTDLIKFENDCDIPRARFRL